MRDPTLVGFTTAVGAPETPLDVTRAPRAPAPLLVISTLENVITVICASVARVRVADTLTDGRLLAENAYQISEVPPCRLVRTANRQVSCPPDTLLTVCVVRASSVPINASKSSLPEAIEKVGAVNEETSEE